MTIQGISMLAPRKANQSLGFADNYFCISAPATAKAASASSANKLPIKVSYDKITKLLLVPLADKRNMALAVCCSESVVGSSSYLVIQFDANKKQDILKGDFQAQVQSNRNDPTCQKIRAVMDERDFAFEFVARVFSSLSGKPISRAPSRYKYFSYCLIPFAIFISKRMCIS